VRKAKPRKAASVGSGMGGSMSAEHKRALAAGREEGRAVRAYLEALEAHRPKRGRKRTAESISRRLEQIDAALSDADPLARVHLAQERLDLQSALEAGDDAVDMSALEQNFIAVAGAYAERKGL
jgi:hypothetical protein